MQRGLLDHLNDGDFCRALDELYDAMTDAVVRVTDHWLELGYIDERGKEAMLDDFHEEKCDLFKCLG